MPDGSLGALRVQQHLDAGVRGRLERAGPAADGAAVTAELLPEALERSCLFLGPSTLEHRAYGLEELGRAGVRLDGGPACESVTRLLREQLPELRTHLFGTGHDEPSALRRPHPPVDLLGHLAEVVGRELVDVALEARLRPAALVVSARLLLAQVPGLLEPSGPEPVEASPLAVHDRHERAVAAADERRQRREVELALELDPVGHCVRELE